MHAIVLGTPPGTAFHLEGVRPAEGARVRALGGGDVAWRLAGEGVALELGSPLPEAPAHAFAISRVAD